LPIEAIFSWDEIAGHAALQDKTPGSTSLPLLIEDANLMKHSMIL